jgi:hypothetical protein
MHADAEPCEILILKSGEVDRLRDLLTGHPSRPYRFLNGLPAEAVTGWWLEDFRSAAADSGGAVFAVEEGGRLVAAAACAPLPWESALLGRRMAAIRQLVLPGGRPGPAALADRLLRRVEAFVLESGAEFLLGKPYTSDNAAVHALERRGFLLMDTLLECVFDLTRTPLDRVAPARAPEGFVLRPAGPNDVPALRELARRSFADHFGRFHADDRIAPEQAVKIYEEWIASCVRGWADWVLVADAGGRLAGYSAWKKPSEAEAAHELPVGHYSIGAVDPEFFGRGVFGALTFAGMRLFPGLADWIEGPTHLHNIPVQRGYLRLGWRLVDARHSFHKWFTEEA